MKALKVLIFGIVIGIALGMWTGYNMGKGKKGKQIFSNPFVEESPQDRFTRKLGESIEKLGEDIKGTVNN